MQHKGKLIYFYVVQLYTFVCIQLYTLYIVSSSRTHIYIGKAFSTKPLAFTILYNLTVL